MSRETKLTGIILKKQPFNEADEIITFFTKEHGKVRGLAKSVKSSKSKLQQRLQALFLVKVTLSHGKLPKIISVESQETFSSLRENLPALKRAFYIVELVLKFTPDEQTNVALFLQFLEALSFLSSQTNEALLDLALAKFKIAILELSGFGIHNISDFRTKASPAAYQLLVEIKNADFDRLKNTENIRSLSDLQQLLSEFIEYQLERQVKSEGYLRQKM